MKKQIIALSILSLLLVINSLFAYEVIDGLAVYDGQYGKYGITEKVNDPTGKYTYNAFIEAKGYEGYLCIAYVMNHTLKATNIWLQDVYLKQNTINEYCDNITELPNGTIINEPYICNTIYEFIETPYLHNVNAYFDHFTNNNKEVYYNPSSIWFDSFERRDYIFEIEPIDNEKAYGKFDTYLWNDPNNEGCRSSYLTQDYNFLYIIDPIYNASYVHEYRVVLSACNNTFHDSGTWVAEALQTLNISDLKGNNDSMIVTQNTSNVLRKIPWEYLHYRTGADGLQQVLTDMIIIPVNRTCDGTTDSSITLHRLAVADVSSSQNETDFIQFLDFYDTCTITGYQVAAFDSSEVIYSYNYGGDKLYGGGESCTLHLTGSGDDWGHYDIGTEINDNRLYGFYSVYPVANSGDYYYICWGDTTDETDSFYQTATHDTGVFRAYDDAWRNIDVNFEWDDFHIVKNRLETENTPKTADTYTNNTIGRNNSQDRDTITGIEKLWLGEGISQFYIDTVVLSFWNITVLPEMPTYTFGEVTTTTSTTTIVETTTSVPATTTTLVVGKSELIDLMVTDSIGRFYGRPIHIYRNDSGILNFVMVVNLSQHFDINTSYDYEFLIEPVGLDLITIITNPQLYIYSIEYFYLFIIIIAVLLIGSYTFHISKKKAWSRK